MDLSFIKNNWERVMIQLVIKAVNKANLVDWMKESTDGFFHLKGQEQLVAIQRELDKLSMQVEDRPHNSISFIPAPCGVPKVPGTAGILHDKWYKSSELAMALSSVQYITQYGLENFRYTRMKNY